MAVVNVTPDSFFDGGRWIAESRTRPNASVVVNQCLRWVEQGAAILDVGGESTRPGSEPVELETERGRVLPVIEALRARSELDAVPISIDTRHVEVARAALVAGADIVNDISGLAESEMAALVAETGAGLVIGHLRGEPATMQADIEFEDLYAEVGAELREGVELALGAGVEPDRILVDPGVGFGKTTAQCAALVASGSVLEELTGRPVVIGASRKRFLGTLVGGRSVEERMLGSVAAAVLAASHGAVVVRVHDVAETVEALAIQSAVEGEARAARARMGGRAMRGAR
jgi:dihydropteroate synthase